mmetsp:Transcript_43915/g.92416  ORF Transcript_43915/g.92416 Transcript_43915/m.92416 type:complete len:718 (+) Transcript_43915:302-2455(+)
MATPLKGQHSNATAYYSPATPATRSYMTEHSPFSSSADVLDEHLRSVTKMEERLDHKIHDVSERIGSGEEGCERGVRVRRRLWQEEDGGGHDHHDHDDDDCRNSRGQDFGETTTPLAPKQLYPTSAQKSSPRGNIRRSSNEVDSDEDGQGDVMFPGHRESTKPPIGNNNVTSANNHSRRGRPPQHQQQRQKQSPNFVGEIFKKTDSFRNMFEPNSAKSQKQRPPGPIGFGFGRRWSQPGAPSMEISLRRILEESQISDEDYEELTPEQEQLLDMVSTLQSQKKAALKKTGYYQNKIRTLSKEVKLLESQVKLSLGMVQQFKQLSEWKEEEVKELSELVKEREGKIQELEFAAESREVEFVAELEAVQSQQLQKQQKPRGDNEKLEGAAVVQQDQQEDDDALGTEPQEQPDELYKMEIDRLYSNLMAASSVHDDEMEQLRDELQTEAEHNRVVELDRVRAEMEALSSLALEERVKQLSSEHAKELERQRKEMESKHEMELKRVQRAGQRQCLEMEASLYSEHAREMEELRAALRGMDDDHSTAAETAATMISFEQRVRPQKQLSTMQEAKFEWQQDHEHKEREASPTAVFVLSVEERVQLEQQLEAERHNLEEGNLAFKEDEKMDATLSGEEDNEHYSSPEEKGGGSYYAGDKVGSPSSSVIVHESDISETDIFEADPSSENHRNRSHRPDSIVIQGEDEMMKEFRELKHMVESFSSP